MTRRGLLQRVAALAAAPMVVPGVAGAAPRDDTAVNFALLLEELQVTLYREAQELDIGFDLGGLIRSFAEQEREHVEGLEARLRELGGRRADTLRFRYELETRDEFLRLAPTVEDLVVGAYVGLIPTAGDPELKRLLTGIVHTEAQQASTLRALAGEPASPAAFEEILGRSIVMDRVRPFIAP